MIQLTADDYEQILLGQNCVQYVHLDFFNTPRL